MAPINNLLRKKTKFNWEAKCEESFNSIKKALTTPPVLIYPDFTKEFTLITDASGESLGAVLEQEGRPVSYASRTLNPAERNYSTTERELLAIVWAVRNYKCYLLGRRFKIITDHLPLRGIFKFRDTTSRMVRFHQKLSEFDFEILYKAGRENGNADALSRIPRDMEKDQEYPCLAITRAQARKEEAKVDKRKSSQPESENEWSDLDETELVTGRAVGRPKPQLITDPGEVTQILKDYHDSRFGGHLGRNKTFEKVKRLYQWKGMKGDIARYIRRCPQCQKNKHSRAIKMPLVVTEVSEKPFEKVYVDLVGPLPVSHNGNKYILSMMDDLTRFVDFVAIPDQEANTVARALFEQILSRYTLPKQLVTDQGTNFTGQVLKDLCKMLKVRKLQTTAYHPQSNAVERQHSTLANYLRSFVDQDPQSWDEFLRTAAHAYNNSVHSGTKLTPMETLFGFVSEVPSSIQRKPEPVYNADKYHAVLRFKLQKAFELARENLLRSKLSAKKHYDKSAKVANIHVGEKVLVRDPARAGKLASIFKGPYEVIYVHSPENVTILQGKRLKRIHTNRLKKFEE